MLFILLLCLFAQGSKAQLEQVWEETDGLDTKDFEPRTFFKLHGELLVTYTVES